MSVNIFIGTFILINLLASTSASMCEILTENFSSDCTYEVRCTIFAGSVNNPSCDSDPNVTFIIGHSTLEHLTAGYFASTNFDSRVRQIRALNNQWTSIESSAFRYYAKCIQLDISNNAIRIINAEAFRNLIEMKFLNLSSNAIKSFNSESFRISEGLHNKLLELDLSNNILEYMGSELNEVPYLTTLYLQDNKLSSVADDAFMSLRDLSHLYLQNNLFTSVNLSLIHLKNLQTLDISNNHLISLSGYEVNRLIALVNFNVSHNDITTVEANCFNQAVNLSMADFSYNDIKIIIKTDMFTNNIKLNYLDFHNNKIMGIQENAFINCTLNDLYLENNNITGDINRKTLANLRNLTKLDLSQQRVSGLKEYAFSDLEKLLYLNISKNLISTVDNSSFVNSSITVLDLSYNKIQHLNFLKNCLANVTELYINNNNISVLPKYIFDNQNNVKKLDLSMNNIVSIEQFSLPLKNLQYLNIVGNQINGAVKQNTFSPARYLRFLDLSYFNISQIDDLAFIDLPVLAKLNLSNNYIKNIDVSSFKGIDNLYSLDVSYNNLTEFKVNSSVIPNIKALHLRNNKLSNISALFPDVCKITYLDLSNNEIKKVFEIGSEILPNLTVLILDDNEIEKFNNIKTNSLTSLIDLSLSSNNINDITLGYFKDLISVNLSNNNLAYLNRTVLEQNENLQALDVSRNKISDIPPGTFLSMYHLKLLNISSNHLTNIRYGSFKGLNKLETIDLSRNNIEELKSDIFHVCYELRTLIIDFNRIKTFDMEKLKVIPKLRTLSLGGNLIPCDEIIHYMNIFHSFSYLMPPIELRSIEKIYHDDNVHGVKCGAGSYSTLPTTRKLDLTEPDRMVAEVSPGTSLSLVLTCSALAIILVVGCIIAYIKLFKKHVLIINRDSTMQLRNSIDLNGSEFQNDLLG